MSVARSAYRQLLRVGTRVWTKYPDPNDMCFALFGLLVTRHDFINAGYGGTFAQILRTSFLRPSISDDPHDSNSARISAAFDALRRLNEINASESAFGIRELRQRMVDSAGDKEKEAAEAKGEKAEETEKAASAAPAGDTLEAAPAASTTAGTSASTTAAPSAASPSKSGATTYRLDEGVDLIRGSVLIERSSRRRIQNFPRHCVVCEPISMVFPPYRFCVPPEPAYLLAVRNEYVLHGITDVLLALSATSLYNTHRQAFLQQHGHDALERSAESSTASGGAETVAAERPEQRGFPTCRAELWQLVRSIPTRTVFQTDVLEVEMTTEYVCSNPAAASSPSPSASASGSTSAGRSSSAGVQGRPHSRDGGFSSTTPLKGNASAAGGGSHGGSGRHGSSFATDSAVSGPGSAVAEEDDMRAHLFLYYVYVRNRGPKRNPQRWHAQVLSHHLVVVDVAQAQVLEMGRPGVMGNFPLLPPGASHCFESGTTLSGPEGVIRGSIQINLFNDAGEMVLLDAAIAPTRLTVEVTSAKGFTSARTPKEELVQRSSETDSGAAAGAGAAGADTPSPHKPDGEA